jgi:hypothetical protein
MTIRLGRRIRSLDTFGIRRRYLATFPLDEGDNRCLTFKHGLVTERGATGADCLLFSAKSSFTPEKRKVIALFFCEPWRQSPPIAIDNSRLDSTYSSEANLGQPVPSFPGRRL